MPDTMTPRKRHLNEAQDMVLQCLEDTENFTSARKAKISKPEDQKMQAISLSAEPQSADISSLKQHIQFNDDVMKKQQILLEQELSPDVRKNVQETLEMIQKRNHQLKKELQDMKCRKIYEHWSDMDLINLMLSNRAYEDSAGVALQCRNRYLSTLSIGYLLRRDGSVGMIVGTRNRTSDGMGASVEYHLEVNNPADVCKGYEEKKGNRLTRAIHLLFSYYNCSEAVVSGGNCYSDDISLTLEAFFGPAPSDPKNKIKIGRLVMTSHVVCLLRWYRPEHIDVPKSPFWLIESSMQELKELMAGIGEITFSCTSMDSVDQLMEACDAKDIDIPSGCDWSNESILSVVKENVKRDNNAVTRRIKMSCTGRTNTQWKVLFAHLMESYQTNPDEGVQCTIGMPKCDFHDHGSFVELVLH